MTTDKQKELVEKAVKELNDQFKDGNDPFGLGITSIISKYGKPQKAILNGEEYTTQGWNEAKLKEIKQFLITWIEKAWESGRDYACDQVVKDKLIELDDIERNIMLDRERKQP